MADAGGDLTDEELRRRLTAMGHPVPMKGKLNDTQRQIQRKKLNHLEARERMNKTMAEKQGVKRAREKNDTTITPNRRARGGSRRITMAVVSSSASPVKFANTKIGVVKDELVSPAKSSIVLRDTAASNKDIPDNSPLVIHLVDTFLGSGAGAVPVTLSVSHATKGWLLLAERQTNSDGQCPGLITRDLFHPGFYRIEFDTEEYSKRSVMKFHFPKVEVAVYVDDPSERYTVSVLLMSNGYTATVIRNTRM